MGNLDGPKYIKHEFEVQLQGRPYTTPLKSFIIQRAVYG